MKKSNKILINLLVCVVIAFVISAIIVISFLNIFFR